ncbi:MAG: hypothetical protein OQK71_00440, partial [Desulfobacter sp.]|nr:hypothetical protein [Desulfobacter sp.]
HEKWIFWSKLTPFPKKDKYAFFCMTFRRMLTPSGVQRVNFWGGGGQKTEQVDPLRQFFGCRTGAS